MDLLRRARKLGPVGAYQKEDDQKELLELAQTTLKLHSRRPSESEGIHQLVYSAAPGASSGKLWGPIRGKVTQEFLNEKDFINAVQIGPLRIALKAEREQKSDKITKVFFRQTRVELFGQKVIEKTVSGGGTWKYLFSGPVVDPKTKKTTYLRVMETPSLFVLESPLSQEE